MKKKIRVLLFCGGRGSKTLIAELQRRTDITLTLVVNAYDDGLSTGSLRRFIPGMLGPSDFRKNFSYLIDLYSAEQIALQKIIEFRLPMQFSENYLEDFRAFVYNENEAILFEPLREWFSALGYMKKKKIIGALLVFFNYYDQNSDKKSFDFSDCSVGNLLFSGFYLSLGMNFNSAIEFFGSLLGIHARIINVSMGESYTLVGIKTDGELLMSESSIVGKQSVTPILDTFFLPQPFPIGLEDVQFENLNSKLDWLRAHEIHPQLSNEANDAIGAADVIIFSAGTQHSSLLPSYRIAHSAIQASQALVKIMVININQDHDIQNLSAKDIVDKALHYLGDRDNVMNGITHLLYNNTETLGSMLKFDSETLIKGQYKGAKIIAGNFANPVKSDVHNGYTSIKAIMSLLDAGPLGVGPELDIYVNLIFDREESYASLFQELVEVEWFRLFSKVTLHVPDNCLIEIPPMPKYIYIEKNSIVSEAGYFEFAALNNWWISRKSSNYLAIICGDGEYRLVDIYLALEPLMTSSFGVVLGSRNQSRRQFYKSIKSAYGEGSLRYYLSMFGLLLISALFSLRFGVIFSDPLTGFIIFRRNYIPGPGEDKLKERYNETGVEILCRLLKDNTEIAEVPVSYKTFSGFTEPAWRFRRGIRNLASFFVS